VIGTVTPVVAAVDDDNAGVMGRGDGCMWTEETEVLLVLGVPLARLAGVELALVGAMLDGEGSIGGVG
jgi:hypothetical protein